MCKDEKRMPKELPPSDYNRMIIGMLD